MKRLGPDDIRVAIACQSLLPLIKVARKLLRRRSVTPADVLRVAPGLEAWADERNVSALAIAELVVAGAEPQPLVFTVVAQANPAFTSRRVASVYRRWIETRPRRRA